MAEQADAKNLYPVIQGDPQVHPDAPEDTMLYREPTTDSDESAIADIWGQKLETRVVDASEVPGFLADGWVKSPLELGKSFDGGPKIAQDQMAESFARQGGPAADALAAAEKLAQELGEKVKSLTAERDNALAERDAANERANALETDLSAEKALRAASAEHIRRLEAEAKELKAKRKPA